MYIRDSVPLVSKGPLEINTNRFSYRDTKNFLPRLIKSLETVSPYLKPTRTRLCDSLSTSCQRFLSGLIVLKKTSLVLRSFFACAVWWDVEKKKTNASATIEISWCSDRCQPWTYTWLILPYGQCHWKSTAPPLPTCV